MSQLARLHALGAPSLRAVLAALVLVTSMGWVAPVLADATLIEKLKAGGYNLYIRHTATEWSQKDEVNAYGEWLNCDPGQVRQLSEKGRQDARDIGAALRSLAIPLGRIYASPYCRTRETAQLISGKEPKATDDLMNLLSDDLVGGRDAVVTRARKLLSQPPAQGTNDLFAAHGNLGRAAFGTSLGEGEMLAIAPRGDGGFDVLSTLSLDDLRRAAAK
jgi:hypothetical protein